MDQVRKLKAVHRKSLDLAAEMELINRYALKKLTPDEVYAFSVVLCDNDIDRDGERFDAAGLEKLAQLAVILGYKYLEHSSTPVCIEYKYLF